jgi:hypothetical protein
MSGLRRRRCGWWGGDYAADGDEFVRYQMDTIVGGRGVIEALALLAA